MRGALWLLALFGIAAAVALFAGNNQSTITVFWPPYRVDLALNLVLLLLFGTFMVLHLALRALAALFAMPDQARRWRLQHKERLMHVALLDAVSHLVAGRFIRSRKAAEQVAQQQEFLERGGEQLHYGARLRAISQLLAAEGAHALQDRGAREEHLRKALDSSAARNESPETREGVQLRAAHWALADRDAAVALRWLDELPHGAARRTVALRLRLKAARMAGQTLQALETARLLAKHRAFSESAARGVLRSLAVELVGAAHDPGQLQASWSRLEAAEREVPEVAVAAARRLLGVGGDVELSRRWLLPVWERMVAGPGMSELQRVSLVQALESGFALPAGAPDAAWLTRIETAQLTHPSDALLQYLAGITCMHLQLWGKAQQLLRQSLTRLQDGELQRNAWRALAELAQQRGEVELAAQAWRNAALRTHTGV